MGILGVLPGHMEVGCYRHFLSQFLHPLGMNSFDMKGKEKKAELDLYYYSKIFYKLAVQLLTKLCLKLVFGFLKAAVT